MIRTQVFKFDTEAAREAFSGLDSPRDSRSISSSLRQNGKKPENGRFATFELTQYCSGAIKREVDEKTEKAAEVSHIYYMLVGHEDVSEGSLLCK